MWTGWARARAGAFVVGAVGLIGAPAKGSASPADFVGQARCASCHPQVAAAWAKTPHARPTPPAARAARCVGCHSTGEAPAGKVVEFVVGCESCHGAGVAYAEDDLMRQPALAALLGLTVGRGASRAQVCRACHAAPRTRRSPFDVTAPVHGTPAQEPTS